jgi:hypothetical protein
MTITDKQELIINIDEKTQCFSKQELEQALINNENIKKAMLGNDYVEVTQFGQRLKFRGKKEPKSFCANYERDNVEETTNIFNGIKHPEFLEEIIKYSKYYAGIDPIEKVESKKELLKVYLAIPYSGMEESSYTQATEATMLIINEHGYNVFSPITHSHPIAKLGVKGTWDYWQNIDYQFIDWAEEVWVLVPEQGLTKCFLSTGVTAEMKYAEKHNKRIKLVTKKDNKIVEYGSC